MRGRTNFWDAHDQLTKSNTKISSEIIDTNYQFTTYDDAIELFITGCGGDDSNEQAEVAKAIQQDNKDNQSSLALFTGDMVYPCVSLTTKAEDIKSYFSPYAALGTAKNFAALGNHESGAITPMWGEDPAYGDQDLLLCRRNHAAEIINEQASLICHPYYRIQCIKYGEQKPFLQIVFIDSTTLHFDQAQQQWLQWVVQNSQVKNNLLISHHAIGPSIGKRHLDRDESSIYGPYFFGDSQFIGNQHKVLEKVCTDLGILPEVQKWTKAVGHDHLLGYVEHPTHGNTIYTGGGSSNDSDSLFLYLTRTGVPPSQLYESSRTK